MKRISLTKGRATEAGGMGGGALRLEVEETLGTKLRPVLEPSVPEPSLRSSLHSPSTGEPLFVGAPRPAARVALRRINFNKRELRRRERWGAERTERTEGGVWIPGKAAVEPLPPFGASGRTEET